MDGRLTGATAATRTTAAPPLADVGSLLVTPDEAVRGRHLVDHRVTLAQGVGTGVALLRLAAADVATRGAEPKVERAAALLAAVRLRLREGFRDVIA